MPIVVDTSVILAIVLNEPNKEQLVRCTTGAELVAPLALHWEMGNALSAMLKRQRLSLAQALEALREYRKIPIRFLDLPLDAALRVADQHQIYAYDAYFIVCAQQQNCPLVTLDGGMIRVARSAQLDLVEVTP